ncbi:TPA: hypothetical protein DCX16_02475 [bacterium]|nr:hypothetical protein [bacterium]
MEQDETLVVAKAIAEKILVLMGTEPQIIAKKDGQGISIEININNGGTIIGKDGKNLDALQEIVQAIFFKKTSMRKRVMLDINGYRKRSIDRLMNLAIDIADKVAATKEEVALKPMSAHERYLVHSFLQGDHRVTTISQGEGEARQVVVIPNE